MEIYRAVLDRAKLAAMPENERTLLLLLGHASNEINVLSKLILMIRKDDPPSLVFDHVEAGQTFILIRLLTGNCTRRGNCSERACRAIPPSRRPLCRNSGRVQTRRFRRSSGISAREAS